MGRLHKRKISSKTPNSIIKLNEMTMEELEKRINEMEINGQNTSAHYKHAISVLQSRRYK